MLSPGVHVAMIVLPAAIFFAAVCGLIIALSSPKRGPDLARAGPPQRILNARDKDKDHDLYYEPFALAAERPLEKRFWVKPYPTLEAPFPLLVLALERLAANSKKGRIHLQRPDKLRILDTWQESTGDVEKDADPEVDRWYRWIVVACFYEANENHGFCESLDVRVKTAWKSGMPPTQWPIEAKSLGVENPTGAPPTTSDLFALSRDPAAPIQAALASESGRKASE